MRAAEILAVELAREALILEILMLEATVILRVELRGRQALLVNLVLNSLQLANLITYLELVLMVNLCQLHQKSAAAVAPVPALIAKAAPLVRLVQMVRAAAITEAAKVARDRHLLL